MKKKMGKSQLIAIIISVIIGIIIVALVNIYSPAVKSVFEHYNPTRNDYDILKEYALDVAKGEELDENQDVKVEKKVEEESLKIKIEITKMYGIVATFPITEADLKIEDGVIEYNGILDYDNVVYSEYTNIKMNKAELILKEILLVLLCTFFVYFVFYWFPNDRKINKKY